MATKNTQLPAGIEIFKAGTAVDDAGTTHHFSEADLAGMASSYDPKLREAPLTIGHPADNLPAYGWVAGVARNAEGRLVMSSTRAVEPQFAEMVLNRRFPKRSSSFYPPSHPNNPKPGSWYLRHVAFLGAQQPAIAGLADIPAFAEGDSAEGVINFSEALNPTQATQEKDMDKELQAQLDAANKATAEANAARDKAEKEAAESKAQVASFAEKAKADRNAAHASFAEAEVKAGRLLPKDQNAAVAVLNLLADAQPVEFAEGGTTKKQPPVEWLKALISAGKPVVSFGEHAAGTGGAGSQATKEMSDAEVDKLAKAHMAAHKGVNYSEAVSHVTASFTSST